MRAEDVGPDEKWECQVFYHEQRLVHGDVGELDRRVHVAAYLGTGASNADDVRCSTSEGLDRQSLAQPSMYCTAQHGEGRACIDERILDAHSSYDGTSKDLCCAFACRGNGVGRRAGLLFLCLSSTGGALAS